MKNRITKLVAALAALAALALGGSAIAGAVSQSGSQPQTVGTGSGQVPTYHGRQGGFGTPLTGDTLAKATAAALAKTGGGTVERAVSLPDGTYLVHVITSDNTEVHVRLDKSFAVTGAVQGGPRGPRGGCGPGFGTALTGDTLAKATAAALAKTGGGTVERALALPDGTYEVHVIKADKSEVHVHLDTSFAVTGVDQGGPRGFRGMGASGSGDGAAGGAMGF